MNIMLEALHQVQSNYLSIGCSLGTVELKL
jgi:hypothetical protein